MTGLTTAVLCAVGDLLPPVARLAVYPMWKIELMVETGQLTIAEVRVLAQVQSAANKAARGR